MSKRKKIAAGNWKMNLNAAEAAKLSEEISGSIPASLPDNIEIIIAPPSVNIPSVSAALQGKRNIGLAAQNCHHELSGAFTGEVSAPMLAAVGVKYVILGHSERRIYFGEDNEFIRKKMNTALATGLIPIVCCGELPAEREEGKHFEVVGKQVADMLFEISPLEFSKVIIAYEPVWAIGTGKTATPEQAQEMHAFIRNLIAEKFSSTSADGISILYGGSCNAKNASSLFSMPDIDGGLIGGASLRKEEFLAIISALASA